MGFLPLRLSIKFIISAQRTGFRFLLLTKGSGSVRCLPLWGRWREAPEGLTDRTKPSHSARWRAVKRFKSAKGVWVGETNEVCLRNVRVFPHKQHIKSNCTYPPKQSGGLFRKHTTPLNYSLSTNQKEAARAASFIRSIVTHLSFRYRCSEYHPRSPAAFSAYPSRASEYACAPGSP